MPVKPGGETGEELLRAGEHVGCHVGITVDVYPERYFDHPPRVVRNVLDRALCAPLLLQGESTITVGRRPPVALKGRQHNRVTRSLRRLSDNAAPLRRRTKAQVLPNTHDRPLLTGFGIFRSDIETVIPHKESRDLRIMAEILVNHLPVATFPISQKTRTMVLPRQHGVRLALVDHLVQPREVRREESPLRGAVRKGEPPGLRAVGALLDCDGGVQHAALAAERDVAPDKRDGAWRLGALA